MDRSHGAMWQKNMVVLLFIFSIEVTYIICHIAPSIKGVMPMG